MSDIETYQTRVIAEYPDVDPSPEELEAWAEAVVALHGAGKIADALALSRRLLAGDPRLFASNVMLGKLLYQHGAVAEARYFMHEGLRRARWAFDEGEADQETLDEIERVWGEMDSSAYASLSTETLVEAQVKSFDWPDAALLREILARGADAVPQLHQVLKDDDDGLYHSDFACKLLTTLYVEQHIEAAALAIPDMVRFFRITESDWLDFLCSYLAAFGARVIDPLLEIGADPTLTWYQRGAALDAAVAAAGQSAEAREQVLVNMRTQLADLVAQGQADDAEPVVATLISQLADMRDDVSRGLVERAFELNLPATYFISKEDYDKRFSEGQIDSEPFNVNWLDTYSDEYESAVYDPEMDYLFSDIDFDDEAEAGDDDFDTEAFSAEQLKELDSLLNALKIQRRIEAVREQPFNISEPIAPIAASRKSAKPGRNDPCWCGSGKKYKHCHMRADEAEA
jgi:SEC-C motif/Protein of unknown function (DUF1186)